MLSETYTRVRVRKVILVPILSLGIAVLVGVLVWREPYASTGLGLVELTFFASLGLLMWLFWGRNCGITEIVGLWPNQREAWIYLTLGIPTIGISLLGLCILFLSLSYVVPTLVSELLLDTSDPTFIGSYTLEAILMNSLTVLNVALLVPIVEEIFFRGFILHRWCDKYGEKKAIVLSSILFGVLHVEILGSVVFAVIVSVVCLRTKSLVGPILIHMGNNFMFAVIGLLFWYMGGSVEGTSAPVTIEDFRLVLAAFGIIGAVIGVPWLYWFVKTRLLGTATSA